MAGTSAQMATWPARESARAIFTSGMLHLPRRGSWRHRDRRASTITLRCRGLALPLNGRDHTLRSSLLGVRCADVLRSRGSLGCGACLAPAAGVGRSRMEARAPGAPDETFESGDV